MKKSAIALFAAIAVFGMVTSASAALTFYQQDFEGMNAASGSALSDDGWLIFANVFNSGGAYLYGYGVFPAPNGTGAFCAVAVGEGGAAQGAQQLSVYSDYNNVDHGIGNLIESITFQEQTVSAGDVGTTWYFDFDAKMGNLAGATTAVAFIKTLNPAAGYATTNFITADMTSTPAGWTGYQLSITIDASLVGQILQIGFANTASNYEGSGVFYDNIYFYVDGTIPSEDMSWGDVKSLFK